MLPNGFEKLIRTQLDEAEWFDFQASLNLEPVRGALRVSGKSLGPCPLGEEIPGMESAWYLEPGFKPGLDPGWHTGAYYSQEPSAMFPVERFIQTQVGSEKYDLILDLCAAPGGKAIQLAKLLKPHGCLLANEVVGKRCSILRQNLIRAGISQAAISSLEPEVLASRHFETFQIVLVDAPCSGEGLFRRKPESKNHWSLEGVGSCAKRQQRILKSAWKTLSPGGTLIYSTCTFNHLENAAVLEKFLTTMGGSLLESRTLWPHHFQGEGQFYAYIKKPGDLSFARRFKSKTRPPKILKSFLGEALEKILQDGEISRQNHAYRWEPGALKRLADLPLLARGLSLGRLLGRGEKKFMPAHDLAMVLKSGVPVNEMKLSKPEALDYLRGLDLGRYEGQGWVLMTYEGQGLGWAKVGDDSVVRNRFPKDWRIQA